MLFHVAQNFHYDKPEIQLNSNECYNYSHLHCINKHSKANIRTQSHTCTYCLIFNIPFIEQLVLSWQQSKRRKTKKDKTWAEMYVRMLTSSLNRLACFGPFFFFFLRLALKPCLFNTRITDMSVKLDHITMIYLWNCARFQLAMAFKFWIPSLNRIRWTQDWHLTPK